MMTTLFELIDRRLTALESEVARLKETAQSETPSGLRCIGYMDHRELPLASGSNRPFIVDKKGVNGCMLPVYVDIPSL